MTDRLPLDDFRELLARLPAGDETAAARARQIFLHAGRPPGSLGRLEQVAEWLARWSGRAPPAVSRPLVAVFAGAHGVARRDVSGRPAQATMQDVELCAAGGAAVNQICIAHDLGLQVFDLALHLPTGDIAETAALDERACAATVAFGMEAIANGCDMLAIGGLGVGGSTAAAAMLAALFGGSGADWAGSGEDADAAAVARKAAAIDAALALHRERLRDPIEVLRRLGGREFAAMAGAIVAARMQKIPVVIGGAAGLASAAALWKFNPTTLGHCLFAGAATGPGQAEAVERLGIACLPDFGIAEDGVAAAALGAGLAKTAALLASGLAAAQR